MYIINMYENEYAETLIQSIDTQTLVEVPEVIEGSGTCLKIIDKKSNIRKSFAMCLPCKETLEQIQNLISDFLFNCTDKEKPCQLIESLFETKQDGTEKLLSKRVVGEYKKITYGKYRDRDCKEIEKIEDRRNYPTKLSN